MSLPRTLSQDAVAHAIRAALNGQQVETSRFIPDLVQALVDVGRVARAERTVGASLRQALRDLAEATERAAAREAELLARISALESDAATAAEEDAAELDAIHVLLNGLGVQRTRGTTPLHPVERLQVYLDATRAQVRATVEDDTEEWARSPRTERGLVLALSELGHLLASR